MAVVMVVVGCSFCALVREELEVVLESDFGPMGLRFRAGRADMSFACYWCQH